MGRQDGPMRILRRLVFWGFMAGVSAWSVLLLIVIDQHLPVPNPAIALSGGRLSCSRVIERLALAQSAVPDIYRNRDAGLAAAVAAIDPAACSDWPEGGPRRFAEPGYVRRAQARVMAELAARPALPERPGWLAGLGLAPPDLDTVSPFANLRLWIAAFPGSYAGQGLWHYLRCDDPLTAGPRHGLTMAALHVPPDDPNPPAPGWRDADLRARIAECGMEARFRDDIAATLRASDLLPVRYQE
jgi:hypothetical protein